LDVGVGYLDLQAVLALGVDVAEHYGVVGTRGCRSARRRAATGAAPSVASISGPPSS
jgi:hypothetical protein